MTDGRSNRPEDIRPLIARHFGRDVADLTPMRWGFDADTWCAVFVDGGKVVVQHRRPESADRIGVATEFLAGSGVAVPAILGRISGGTGSYLLFQWVDGEPGACALTGGRGPELATAMGLVADRLRRLDPTGLRGDPTWLGPRQLRAAASSWRHGLPTLPARVDQSLSSVTGAEWKAAPCHGDFAPVNAIIDSDGHLTILDLAEVANGHPWIDPAWWGLIVRHHHPEAFQTLFPAFALAADCEPTLLADVAVVRAWQSAAAADGRGKDHALALLRSAVAWADEVQGHRSA